MKIRKRKITEIILKPQEHNNLLCKALSEKYKDVDFTKTSISFQESGAILVTVVEDD